MSSATAEPASPQQEALLRLLRPHWRRTRGDEPIWIACGDGWLPLITALHHELGAVWPEYHLFEVSQKYGELYFRVDDVPAALEDRVRACVDAAQARALHTCETCGRPGRLGQDRGGWLEVVCEAHARAGGFAPTAASG